ncbi:MAG: Na+/H+ antiporter NhaA [Rhodospirillaceae bacterium]|nr:Na+/H+ antiporter NhaA [Rhodospirillaceae bacterium]|tara:strand:- start:2360 stop:3574 length:1215 start_codon:yes stop_codon:yes gene_type:complete
MATTFLARLSKLTHHEAAGGVLLMMAAAFALLLDNSPLAWLYDRLLSTPVVVQIGALAIDKPLLLWINDGLMAVFFFLVGLEIKRELLEGELSSWRKASLPALAAIGGMMVPALFYAFLNWDDPIALRGWAIPAATDIAFALGILALLGSRVPMSLKIFLLALAIIDDLGAIVIIAAFYTADISLISLSIGLIGAAILLVMNLTGVTRTSFYLIVGIIMWVCVLKSGVHATLAGVIIALTIPLRAKDATGLSPLHKLEKSLHPYVMFGVVPIFAFANAGVSLIGLSLSDLLAPIPLGIALGLFIGKQIGVFGFAWLGVKLRLCHLPQDMNWAQVYGASMLAGIGFTMSLFIGTLAFADPEHASAVRIGVLTGSTLSAVFGYLVLRWATRSTPQSEVGLSSGRAG